MSEQEIIQRVKAELSQQRFEHTQGVVDAATHLAKLHGVEERLARTAAWIHDIAREWPTEKLLQVAEQVEIPTGFASIPAILHGPIGAHLAEQWFGVKDEDVKNAIRYHTTARVGMTVLEKVIYLADAIEAGRRYPHVDRVRELAQKDLALALAESLDSTIQYLIATHQPIFPLTVMARNELWETMDKGVI